MSKSMRQHHHQRQQSFDSLFRDHTKPDPLKIPWARTTIPNLPKRPDGKPTNLSGDLAGAPATPHSKPGHRRSVSAGAPLIYSGGNISAAGKTLKSGIPSRGSTRPDVLGSGTVNYGRGSIVRGGGKGNNGDESLGMVKRAMVKGGGGGDAEEVKRVGNELYRNGNFAEALALYDRAVSMLPGNAAYRSNRAAALTALGRLGEAARECEEAVKLDPAYARAHMRLASLYLR